MPRPNAAQIAYGSATLICSAIAMLLLSGIPTGPGVVVIGVAALALGLLVALTVPLPQRAREARKAREDAATALAALEETAAEGVEGTMAATATTTATTGLTAPQPRVRTPRLHTSAASGLGRMHQHSVRR